MEKFNRALRGYDPDEVNAFLDKVINQVETMVSELKNKDTKIRELQSMASENVKAKEKIAQYERMEATLNKAIIMAQKTSDQIKASTHRECELLLEDAKRSASRIVNEALMRAEATEMEANILKRNITIFKKKLKNIIEQQLEMVNEIDKVDF